MLGKENEMHTQRRKEEMSSGASLEKEGKGYIGSSPGTGQRVSPSHHLLISSTWSH